MKANKCEHGNQTETVQISGANTNQWATSSVVAVGTAAFVLGGGATFVALKKHGATKEEDDYSMM